MSILYSILKPIVRRLVKDSTHTEESYALSRGRWFEKVAASRNQSNDEIYQ